MCLHLHNFQVLVYHSLKQINIRVAAYCISEIFSEVKNICILNLISLIYILKG